METKQLTADLRKWLAELAELKSKTNKLEAKVFAHTYKWVEQLQSRTLDNALASFADTFKVGVSAARHYYSAGRYMHENRLDANVVDHRAVMLAQSSERRMAKADRLKTLDAVRKGQNRRKVADIVRPAVHKKVTDAQRKAKRLERAEKLTRNGLKMEAMALLTLARKLYSDGEVSIEIKVDGKTRVKVS